MVAKLLAITEWNAEVANLSGYSKAESVDQHLVQRFIAEELKALWERCAYRRGPKDEVTV